MDDTPPKKKKKSTPVTDKTETLNVKALLESLLKEKLSDKEQHVRNVESLTNALVTTLSEFLGCFYLLGYDNNGSPVVLSYSKTEMQADALSSLLFKFVTIHSSKYNHPNDDGIFD